MGGPLSRLAWYPYKDEPVVLYAFRVRKVSHPTVLLPAEAGDGRWHMAVDTVFGIQHYTSSDGLKWAAERMLVPHGRNPQLFRAGSDVCLAYTEDGAVFLVRTKDFALFGRPVRIFDPKMPLSSPCFCRTQEGWALYFGTAPAGEGRNDPMTRVCMTSSHSLAGPWSKPCAVMERDADDPWWSMSLGPAAVTSSPDGWEALVASSYWDRQAQTVRRALTLAESTDGKFFQRVSVPLPPSDGGWAEKGITSASARYNIADRTWYCYYSATDGKRESVGLLLGRENGTGSRP